MSQMINRGKELIRISPKDPTILEYSTNEGRTWIRRSKASSVQGAFINLIDNGLIINDIGVNWGVFFSCIFSK